MYRWRDSALIRCEAPRRILCGSRRSRPYHEGEGSLGCRPARGTSGSRLKSRSLLDEYLHLPEKTNLMNFDDFNDLSKKLT